MILRLNEWREAKGTVVVIDVLRAFTTSSYILDKDPKSFHLIKELMIGLNTKLKYPETVLVGEKGGNFIKGFDHFNSPFDISTLDLKNKDVILRTSSGTRGSLFVSRLPAVKEILAGGFTTAESLKKYLKDKKEVTYLITGSRTPDGGMEDVVLAEYLMGKPGSNLDYCHEEVYNSYSSINWIEKEEDLDYCFLKDFNFIQRISKSDKSDNFLIMSKEVV